MTQSVYARLIFYVLSTLLAMLPPALAGWGVTYDAAAHVVSINVEALATAIAAAVAASGVVFKLWGTK